jgi:hypothetical protein
MSLNPLMVDKKQPQNETPTMDPKVLGFVLINIFKGKLARKTISFTTWRLLSGQTLNVSTGVEQLSSCKLH